MQVCYAVVRSNEKISRDVYRMVLHTSIASQVQCGQFVQVQVPGFYLRRPISVSEVLDDNHLVLVYKTVGEGTAVLSQLKENESISLFGPLGTGFPVKDRDVVLIGGGVGVPPLVETAKQYILNGNNLTAVLGFNTKEDAILVERLKETGTNVCIATMDGSLGTKGTVMDAIDKEKYDSMSDFELVDELSRISGVAVPQAIEEIRTAPVRHKTVCEVSAMTDEVKKFLGI